MTGRHIDFAVSTERGVVTFVAHIQPSDTRRLIKEIAEAEALGWLRAGEAHWKAIYNFLERVLGAEEYSRLLDLVADGIDANGYADDGDTQLEDIVLQLLSARV